MKKFFFVLLFIFLFILIEIATNQSAQKPLELNKPQLTNSSRDVKGESINQQGVFVKVTKVIDGDTIQIEDGRKLRYIGIDTPETVDPRRQVECFGKEASAKNKELVEGKIVKMVKDISETDKYKRLLRYIWVGNLFVNDYLVRQGYATAATFPPDVKYQEQFRQAESQARARNLGLWSLCQ